MYGKYSGETVTNHNTFECDTQAELDAKVIELGFEIPVEEGKPTMSNTKAEIKAYMDENGIEFNSSDTKADLLQKIEWHNN